MKRLTISGTIILATLCVAFSTSAQAEDQRTTEYQHCMENIDLGVFKNSQWLGCAETELARQDNVLNAEYKTLRASLSAERKNLLLQGQRAWLKYRDSWCQFEGQTDSAPSPEMNHSWCMLELTDKQIELIQAQQY